MNSQFDIFYEVVEPGSQKTEFITQDRFIAETQYAEGYTVYEKHRTTTRLSQFTDAMQQITLCWHDEDSDPEPEEEED